MNTALEKLSQDHLELQQVHRQATEEAANQIATLQAQLAQHAARLPASPTPPFRAPAEPTVLQQSMETLQKDLQLNGLIQSIRKFHGDSHKALKSYIRELETARASLESPTDIQMRAMVLRTVRDTAMDFCHRFITENPTCTWDQLKHVLRTHFSDSADSEAQRRALNKAKQSPNETMIAFSERILSYGEDAFGADFDERLAQKAMISAFKDGLRDTNIAARLIRRDHSTFAACRADALKEAASSRRVQLRRWTDTEEDMDISLLGAAAPAIPSTGPHPASSPQSAATPGSTSRSKSAHLECIEGKIDGLTSVYSELLAIEKQKYSNQNTRSRPTYRKQLKWVDGKPVCTECEEIGHIRRYCAKWLQKQSQK